MQLDSEHDNTGSTPTGPEDAPTLPGGRPLPPEAIELNGRDPVRIPVLKSVLDKVISLFLLVLTSPLWIVIIAAELLGGLFSATDRGPVFYGETRVSAGQPFRLWKFRILTVRAIREDIEAGVMPKKVENTPGNLTAVGRVLKKTGLDELPQFWLVLKGDMSLVGPRPKPVAEYEEEIARGVWRRRVFTAGLTGPAQLLKGTKRSPLDDLMADLKYIERFRTGPGWRASLGDFALIGRTVLLMLKFTGE